MIPKLRNVIKKKNTERPFYGKNNNYQHYTFLILRHIFLLNNL